MMTGWAQIGVFAAGLGAGTINTVVGSGTLITFPVLLAVGLPPVTANVSNTIGLVPGSISGAVGYRRELAGQRGRLIRLGAASVVGGVAGAALLIVLPASAFRTIVPALILAAILLVVLQPRLARAVAARRKGAASANGGPVLTGGVTVSGIYGGYFGAAQGVLLLGLMGLLLEEELQRVNGLKNVLAGLVNAVASVFFLFTARVDWRAAVLIAVGSAIGGQIGAHVGRRLPPIALRAVIVVVGLAAVVQLLRG